MLRTSSYNFLYAKHPINESLAIYLNNSSVLFELSYAIFLSVMIIRQSFLSHVLFLDKNIVFKSVCFFGLLLLAVKEYIINEKHALFFVHIFIILLLTLIIKHASAFTTATSLYYLFSSRNEDFKRIAIISIRVTMTVLFCVIVLGELGVIANYQFDVLSQRPREFLGFKYALYAPAFFFNIVALNLYIKKKNVRFWEIGAEIIVCYWLYLKTDSRLSYLLTMLLIFSSLIIKFPYHRFTIGNKKYIHGIFIPVIKTLIVCSFIICSFVSIFFTIKYNPSNSIQKKINNVLTQRLYYGQKSYKEYGITLLGQQIEWVGNGVDEEGNQSDGDYLYVDNLYQQFMQRYGLLFYILVMFCLTYYMYKLVTGKQWMLIFIMLIIAGHMMLDDLVLHIWYNTFWFAAIPYLFKENITKRMWDLNSISTC